MTNLNVGFKFQITRGHASAFSRRRPSEVCMRFTLLEKEGRRESRVPIAPAVVHKSARVDHRATGSSRLSPREWVTAYTRPSRGDQLSSPRRPRIDDAPEPGRARCISEDLAPAWGAGTTRLRRPRPSPLNAPPGLAARQSSDENGWQHRSSARRLIAHKPKPALQSLARPTLSRPSHPTAQFVTTRDPPLLG
jgi:hypothetical protein